jgi:hypothetical protein
MDAARLDRARVQAQKWLYDAENEMSGLVEIESEIPQIFFHIHP